MKLYVSNTTKQNRIFHVRHGGNIRLIRYDIPSGGQIEINQSMLGADAEGKMKAIIAELERWGARDAAELHGDVEGYSGIAYRFEAPVSADEISEGHEKVVDQQQRVAAQESAKSVLGFDRSNQRGGKRGARLAETTEVEIVEDVDPRNATGNELKSRFVIDPTGGELPKALRS